ncbi:hypothetical protein SK128_014952 [Halocaridina rubra]|uniref:Fibronectin type-III domain-containing protein n=1 Tax=Halocaridina rubra TaxID=373956 RepID=A0AAN8WR82_HALRR
MVGLSGNFQRVIRVSVTAQAKDPETLPIYTLSWISTASTDVDASVIPVIIFAKVSQGAMPVVGARVRAYITRPYSTNTAVEIDLKDNGQGADVQMGDGIYSRYFTLFTTTGRYAVKAQVWDEGSSYINNGFIASRQQKISGFYPPLWYERISPLTLTRLSPMDPLNGPDPCCGSSVPFDPSKATPTGPFLRTSAAGSFKVTKVPLSGDVAAPSRVLNLQVSPNNYTSLNLNWTAPGDDYDIGTVLGYEIRMSTNRNDLLEDTFNGTTNSTLLLGLNESMNMTEIIVEAGETAYFLVQLQRPIDEGTVYYFALRATDHALQQSKVSNIGLLFIDKVSPKPDDGLPSWAVALIVIGTLMIIALIGAIIYISDTFGLRSRNPATSSTPGSQF